MTLHELYPPVLGYHPILATLLFAFIAAAVIANLIIWIFGLGPGPRHCAKCKAYYEAQVTRRSTHQPHPQAGEE